MTRGAQNEPGGVLDAGQLRSPPAQLWTSQAMQQAAGRPGRIIALTRQAHRLTQRQLGDLAGYTQSAISRLEDGANDVYDIRVLRRFATLLRIPPHLFGLADGLATIGPPHEEQDVKRRAFLEIPAALAAARQVPPGPRPTHGKVSVAHVRMVRDRIAALHTLDRQIGGDNLHEPAGLLFAHTQRWLNECTHGQAMERRLYSAVGDAAVSAGWFAYDAGLQNHARNYFNEGLRAAVLAEDDNLEARVYLTMALQARFLGRPREAVGLARRAQHLTTGQASRRLASLVYAREALALSRLKETSASQRALDRSREILDAASRDRPPAWLTGMNFAELAGLSATAEMDLENFQRAAELTCEALDAYGDAYPRNAFFYLIQLAECHQHIGALDESCHAGHQALALLPEVTSTRSRNKLRAFRNTLMLNMRRERLVREFLDHCTVIGL